MHLFLLLLALFLAPVTTPADVPQTLTPEMIQAMMRRKAWSELVSRLDEVEPAQRDAQWQKAVEVTALAYIDELIGWRSKKLDRMCDQLLIRYPTLSEAPRFLQIRRKLVLQSAEECYRHPVKKSSCSRAAYDAVLRHPKDVVLVRELASKVQMLDSASGAAKVLLVGARHDAALCREPTFWAPVLEAITKSGEKTDWAEELSLTKCKPDVAMKIRAEIVKRGAGASRGLCAVLRKTDASVYSRSSECKTAGK